MKNWACTNDGLVLLMVVVLYPPYIIENISDYYTIDCFSTIFWLKKKFKKFLIFFTSESKFDCHMRHKLRNLSHYILLYVTEPYG